MIYIPKPPTTKPIYKSNVSTAIIGSKIDMMVGEKLIIDFFIRINYFCSTPIEQKLYHYIIYVKLT